MMTVAAALPKVHRLPFISRVEFEPTCTFNTSLITCPAYHRSQRLSARPPMSSKRKSISKAFSSDGQFASSIATTTSGNTRKSHKKVSFSVKSSSSRVSAIPHSLESGSESSLVDKQPGNLFCFGFGYTTLGLANTLKKEGWLVTGTCRSEEKKEALIARGLPAVVFDTDGEIEGLESDGLAALRSATHLIASIPPVADFDQDPALALNARQIREAADQRLKWIGYLSTTGVYGDWDGHWVDENTKPRPSNQRAAARLRAEEAWLALGREAGIPVHIFRLGGIYGPSRSALDAVRSGRTPSQTQRVREARRFTSRCHVADIVRVVTAAIRRPASGGRIYNVVDDDPAPRRQVVAYARQLLRNSEESQVEQPRQQEESLSGREAAETAAVTSADVQGDVPSSVRSEQGSCFDGSRAVDEHERRMGCDGRQRRLVQTGEDASEDALDERTGPKQTVKTGLHLGDDERGKTRGVDEKRVRNDRIKQELGLTLAFPSYKEGLTAIAGGDMQPFD